MWVQYYLDGQNTVRLGPEFWAFFFFFLFTCLVNFCFLGFYLGVAFKMFLLEAP